MAIPSVTYTFTNSTTADAAQVNQNFNDLISGMTDGSKSFSIDSITCAGTATFNGAVNLGNATGDDITVTGYLASALVPKTDDTYDIGTAALAWQDIYLDGKVYTDAIDELTTANGVLIDGVTIKDGSVKLLTTGGTATTLDYYEEYNTALTPTGAGSTGSVSYMAVRIGKIVTLTVKFVLSGSGIANDVNAVTLADRLRPGTALYNITQLSAGDTAIGFTISASGVIEIFKQTISTAALGSAFGSGTYAFTISYVVGI